MTDSKDNKDKQPTANSQRPTAGSQGPPEITPAAEKAAKLDAEATAARQPARRLDEMTVLDLRRMEASALRGLCQKAGLSGKGKKDELIERLRSKVRRITRQYIEGVTTCAYCPADIMVTGTDKQPSGDGRVLVVRQIKCKGKHHHKYPLKEMVKADK